MSIQDKLKDALATAETRSKVYGGAGKEGHRLTGAAMAQLFPEGVTLKTADDFIRFLLFCMIMTKNGRYAINFDKGGHQDSIHDLGVYAFLLEDFDHPSIAQGEVQPHVYFPDHQMQGDCRVCGNKRNVPWHIGEPQEETK